MLYDLSFYRKYTLQKSIFPQHPDDINIVLHSKCILHIADILGTGCYRSAETESQAQIRINQVNTDFIKRLSNVQYQCTSQGITSTNSLPRLYVLERNDLKYCKIPKAGSTFWMEVLIILTKNANADQTFGRKRSRLHVIAEKNRRKINITEISCKDKGVIVTEILFQEYFRPL